MPAHHFQKKTRLDFRKDLRIRTRHQFKNSVFIVENNNIKSEKRKNYADTHVKSKNVILKLQKLSYFYNFVTTLTKLTIDNMKENEQAYFLS